MTSRLSLLAALAACLWLGLGAELGHGLPSQSAPAGAADRSGTDVVDLSGEELESIEQDDDSHVLAEPWYRRLDVSGFGAVAYLDGGDDSARDVGGFQVKEASLFLELEAWANAFFFLEIQTNRLGRDSSRYTRTGEVYLHFRDVLRKRGEGLQGVKMGRIDIPFGEEYLWQDANTNPLISQTAAYAYGLDEGVLLYGKYRGLSWIASVTDGHSTRSVDDHADKAVNLKLYGQPLDWLYLSASAMANGSTARSAIEFGGSNFRPVGSSGPSAVGESPSEFVDADLFGLDAKITFGGANERGHLALAYGEAMQDDEIDVFDRDLRWFMVETVFDFTEKLYGVVRYSEIGTYDRERGFHFDGKPVGGGRDAYGFDASSFDRLSLGLGYRPNPHILFKLEIGRDRFEVIDSSPLDPSDDDRDLIGLSTVFSF